MVGGPKLREHWIFELGGDLRTDEVVVQKWSFRRVLEWWWGRLCIARGMNRIELRFLMTYLSKSNFSSFWSQIVDLDPNFTTKKGRKADLRKAKHFGFFCSAISTFLKIFLSWIHIFGPAIKKGMWHFFAKRLSLMTEWIFRQLSVFSKHLCHIISAE